MSFHVKEPCERCEGTGEVEISHYSVGYDNVMCPTCQGDKTQMTEYPDGLDVLFEVMDEKAAYPWIRSRLPASLRRSH